MAELIKTKAGKILYDNFATAGIENWLISPEDLSRYSLTERPGYLRLKHGTPDIYLLRPLPADDFIFEAEFDYKPTVTGDTGGVTLYTSPEERVDIQIYYDATIDATKTYSRCRIVKTGNTYSLYSFAGSWELVGTTDASPLMIGVVLSGADSVDYKPFDISQLKISGRQITVIGLDPGMKVELYDSNNILVASATAALDVAIVDDPTIELGFTGYIKVYDAANTLLLTSDPVEIWPGDVFQYHHLSALSITSDGSALSLTGDNNFGKLTSGKLEKKLALVNNSDTVFTNVTISVVQYDTATGWQMVTLALPDESNPNLPGTYSSKITIPTVQACSSYDFWLKIDRTGFEVDPFSDCKFKLAITF